MRTIKLSLPSESEIFPKEFSFTTGLISGFQITRKGYQDKEHVKLKKNIEANLCSTAVYFLFGEDPKNEEPMVYVGESGDGIDRLSGHDTMDNKTGKPKKEFWNSAVVFTSSKPGLFDTDMCLYLEHYIIQKVKEFGRYRLFSDRCRNIKVSPQVKADAERIFDEMEGLLACIGYKIFNHLASKTVENERDTFYITSQRECNGRLIRANEGWVVLKGSICAISKDKNSYTKTWEKNIEEGLEKGYLRKKGGGYEFITNRGFNTPSAAANLILGTKVNGWENWKNKGATATLKKIHYDLWESK